MTRMTVTVTETRIVTVTRHTSCQWQSPTHQGHYGQNKQVWNLKMHNMIITGNGRGTPSQARRRAAQLRWDDSAVHPPRARPRRAGAFKVGRALMGLVHELD